MTTKVLLFGTLGCHLCEQAEAMAAGLEHSFPIEFEMIDIAEHEQWQNQYAIRIPVVYHPESQTELCWPFNIKDLKQFLNELNK